MIASSDLTVSSVSAQMRFTRTNEAAGLTYIQHDLQGGFADILTYSDGGAAAGDYNDDGWVDLFVTRRDAADILYRNNGDGTFTDVTAEAGIDAGLYTAGAMWADIDNDGDQDLYVTTTRPGNRVIGPPPGELPGARFQGYHYLYINDGNGRFTEESIERNAAVDTGLPRNVFGASLGDYDNDGFLDLHTDEQWIETPGVSHSRLLRNRGAEAPGHFDDMTVNAGVLLHPFNELPTGLSFVAAYASWFSDLDNDGWADLVIAGDWRTSRIYWNNHDGTFSDGTAAANVGGEGNAMGSTIGDYDGDGRLDWFVTAIYDTSNMLPIAFPDAKPDGNRLYRNLGDRRFECVTDVAGVREGGWGWGASFLDYDNDGDLDLAMTNGLTIPLFSWDDPFNDDPSRLWRNNGDGTMTEVSSELGFDDTASGKGLLVFDYDNDGDLDVFVAVNGDRPILYRNDGGNRNHWLRVDVVGTRSNRDGIGARVTLTAVAGGQSQVREISAGSNFLGQNERTAHFGLGQHVAPVAEVRVYWPLSRQTQLIENVLTDRLLTVVEPATDCTGDCNGDDDVTVNEIVRGVSVALGALSVDRCPRFDANADAAVTVDEVVDGITRALGGCVRSS